MITYDPSRNYRDDIQYPDARFDHAFAGHPVYDRATAAPGLSAAAPNFRGKAMLAAVLAAAASSGTRSAEPGCPRICRVSGDC